MSMSKTITDVQFKAIQDIVNDNMEAEKEHLANTLRDCGEHDLADEVQDDLTTDERIAEICDEMDETNSSWYQYYILSTIK